MKKISLVEFKNNNFICFNSDSQRLFTKGFGTFLRDEILQLSWYEVLYLLDKKSIKVVKGKNQLEFEDLIKIKKFDSVKYLVYSDLKKQGFIVKEGLKFGADFRVYVKNQEHAKWLVLVFKSSEKIKCNVLSAQSRVANSTNKKLLFAIVDEELHISYLESSWTKNLKDF